jgi:glycosyltransferase involved in cell wall biosynthesis
VKNRVYLPATILSERPFIFISFFEDFLNWKDGFLFWIKQNEIYKDVYALFNFGWNYEDCDRIEFIKKELDKLRVLKINLRTFFLCNSLIEFNNLKEIGENCVFCSQNAFLKESRYLVTRQKKIYDAVYLARLTPFKRHELAMNVPRLLLIGSYSQKEKDYAKGILDKLQNNATHINKVRGIFMFRYINQAKVGLGLSEEEGAMYAATEYGLCGVPLVTTRNKGGREQSLCADYVHVLETDSPSPEGVAEAVVHIARQEFSPEKIRNSTIQVLKQHRGRFEKLIRNIYTESGQGTEKDFKRAVSFPHKFGLRCRLWPFFKYFRGMKIIQ